MLSQDAYHEIGQNQLSPQLTASFVEPAYDFLTSTGDGTYDELPGQFDMPEDLEQPGDYADDQ